MNLCGFLLKLNIDNVAKFIHQWNDHINYVNCLEVAIKEKEVHVLQILIPYIVLQTMPRQQWQRELRDF